MQLKDVAEIPSSKAESHVNDNHDVYQNKKRRSKKRNFYEWRLFSYIIASTLRYFGLLLFLFSTNFFYSFIKEVTLNYWCDLPSESKQGSKKTSQLPFLDKFT